MFAVVADLSVLNKNWLLANAYRTFGNTQCPVKLLSDAAVDT